MNLRSMFFVLLSIAGRQRNSDRKLGFGSGIGTPVIYPRSDPPPLLNSSALLRAWPFGEPLFISVWRLSEGKNEARPQIDPVSDRAARISSRHDPALLYSFFYRFPLRGISCQWLLKKVGWRFHRNGWARKVLASQSSLAGSSIRTAIKMTNGGERTLRQPEILSLERRVAEWLVEAIKQEKSIFSTEF